MHGAVSLTLAGFCLRQGQRLSDWRSGGIYQRQLAGGISYALDSAEILRSVLLKLPEKLNTAYWRATRKLRLKLFGKIVKADA